MTHRDLWAPWRMAYLRQLEAEESSHLAGKTKPAHSSANSNFLLAAWNDSGNDLAHLVVHRNAHGLIMLNRYPYSNGHVLIALGDPRPTLLEYAPEQRAEFWQLVDLAVKLVERAFSPQGVNVGINQGRAAGAGVPEHLHAHVLPRWNSDTNFMATIGDVRVIPEALEHSLELLRRAATE